MRRRRDDTGRREQLDAGNVGHNDATTLNAENDIRDARLIGYARDAGAGTADARTDDQMANMMTQTVAGRQARQKDDVGPLQLVSSLPLDRSCRAKKKKI